MTQPKPVIVWLSRHSIPSDFPAQFADYTVIQVKSRWTTLKEAQRAVFEAAGCKPAIVIFVLPTTWHDPFAKYMASVSPETLLLRVKKEDTYALDDTVSYLRVQWNGATAWHSKWCPEDARRQERMTL